MYVYWRFLRSVALMTGGIYSLWLWWGERNPLELWLAGFFFFSGAAAFLLGLLRTYENEERADVRRPRVDPPAEGLDGAGWGRQRRE